MSEKLQKVLATAGKGSRREMERWISEGRVSVNGKLATLGDRVIETDKILLDGRPVKRPDPKSHRNRILIYNKPEGEIVTRKDPEGRKTVFDRLPRLEGERWISVGRLDFNTSGLLLFTNDGELANALMHPSRQVDREYLCRVMGEVDDAMLARLREGVALEDGVAKFNTVGLRGGEGINRWYHVTLTQGRNKEVRRLWESQGVLVNRLKRVRYGNVIIPSFLAEGKWVEMDPKARNEVYKLVDVQTRREPPLSRKEKDSQERQLARLRRRGGGRPTR
ncbi:MAG: 23S rRNA pseudouridine(2605) synthase RluB [Pseudomonadales bacterium]